MGSLPSMDLATIGTTEVLKKIDKRLNSFSLSPNNTPLAVL